MNQISSGSTGADSLTAFRWLLVTTQAATILITWPLWQVRTTPPMLPALPLPQCDWGPWLLVTLAIVLVRPLWGVSLHTGAIAWAMLLDQMRLQPEIISQCVLLWGTLPFAGCRLIGRVHLIALWFYAGFYKLFSPEFIQGDALRLLTKLSPTAPASLALWLGLAIALSEIGLAGLALMPATRRVAAWYACAFHVGIFVALSPIGICWDEAVWPWNIALAMSGFAMISTWDADLIENLRRTPHLARFAVGWLLLSPLGFNFGWVDSYLCHILYSNHAPIALIERSNAERAMIDTRPKLKAPVPQVQRLYEAHFAKVARAGDRLEIHDPRWWFRWRGMSDRVLHCEPDGNRGNAPQPGASDSRPLAN